MRFLLTEFRAQFLLSFAAAMFIYCCALQYKISFLKAKHDARIKSIHVPLRYEPEDFGWYSAATYGLPPQRTLKTSFLTSYTESWVVKSNGAHGDLGRGGYDEVVSRTAFRSDKMVDQYYGRTRVKGFYGQDSLFLTPSVVVKNQSLVLLDVIEGGPEKWDMTIGLGYRNPRPAHKDLLENMVEQELIDEPVFSYHISRNTSKPSSIQFGRPQESHYTGELHYVDLERSWPTGPGGWFIRTEGIRARGPHPAEVCSGPGCRMYVDPSGVLIRGPKQEVAKLNQALGAELDRVYTAMQVYNYPSCEEAYGSPDLVFTFNGRDFVLRARDYVLKVSKTCISTLVPHDESHWELGSPFMERYYTVFDRAQDRIGFAPKPSNGDKICDI